MCLSLVWTTLLSADTVLYVKPGGTGDGSSWANAADLASAVATAKAAGTAHSLYLAKGFYLQTTALDVVPGTSFYGGFAGESESETTSGRDLESNQTIVCGGNYYWRYGTGNDNVYRDGKQVYLWTNDVFNEPDPTEAERYWKPNGALRLVDIRSVTATGAKLVFDGLVISAACIRTGKTPLDVRNCQFWGCYDDFGILWSSASMSVTDCTFWWSNGPMISSDSAATTDEMVVSNVVMKNCSAIANGRGFGVYAPNVKLTVTDCLFVSNITACAAGTAPFITGTDNSRFTIQNSVFKNISVEGGAIYLVWLPNYNASVISNCLFEANRVVGDRGSSSTAIASVIMAQRTNHELCGCSFVSNVVNRTEAATKSGETTLKAAVVRSTYLAPIRNCTFDGNRVSAVATDPSVTPMTATVIITGGNDNGAWFGNTFYNNDVATAEVLMDNRNGTGVLQIFNSILWNDKTGYVPAKALNANGRMGFHYSDITNLTADSWITARENLIETDPLLSSQLTAVGKILVRKPTADSPLRKQGARIYRDSSSTPLFAYAPSGTYLRCDTLGTSSLTAPYTLLPDAAGVYPLTGDGPDIGAVNNIIKAHVTYVFDLGLRGTFEGGGTTRTLELETDDPVVVPAYTVNDGYTLRKWRDEVPATAGNVSKTFKAYYWGPIVEIDAGDDLSEVIAYGASREDGAEIRAGAGDYAVTKALTLPANVVLNGTNAHLVSSVSYIFDQSSLAAGEDPCRISGIAFVGGAVSANAIKMSFENCVFSNATASGATQAIHSKTNVTIKGCTFCGNTLCLLLQNAPQGMPVSITDTTFRGNSGNSNGTFFNVASAYLTIDNCTFEDNTNAVAGASMMSGSDWASFRINRSRFERNVASNALSIVPFPNHTVSWISNSLFQANAVIGDRGNNGSGVACLIYARRQTHPIVNTAFISNVVDRTEAATKSGVTEMRALLINTDYHNYLLNDTFVGNTVKAAVTSEGVTPFAALFRFAGGENGAVANLTFKDNVAADGHFFLDGNNGINTSFFNCIFAGAKDTVYFARPSDKTTTVQVFNSVVGDEPDEDWVTLTNCKYGTPIFCDGFDVENGVWTLKLRQSTSVGRRGGIQVATDAGAKLVYQSGSTWYRCDSPSSTWQVTAPYTPIADACGRQPGRRIAMGARYDAENPGLLLIVR